MFYFTCDRSFTNKPEGDKLKHYLCLSTHKLHTLCIKKPVDYSQWCHQNLVPWGTKLCENISRMAFKNIRYERHAINNDKATDIFILSSKALYIWKLAVYWPNLSRNRVGK